jgi:hypothetical protein
MAFLRHMKEYEVKEPENKKPKMRAAKNKDNHRSIIL